MFFKKDDVIPPALAQIIEDAILFGHVTELDKVLETVDGDSDFPEELRYGLQALRHFRDHYGKGGVIEPEDNLQKQKAIVMESAWGAELLDKLRNEHKITALRQA